MIISTVICTYNRVDILKESLDLVSKQNADPGLFEVLIIDNNSNDSTKDFVTLFITDYQGPIKFRYFLETKKGLSAARNRAILESHGSYINYIDDDALLPENYIGNLLKEIEENPEVAGIGGKILPKYFHSEPAWMSKYTWGLVSKHDLGNEKQYYTKTGVYPTGCNMTYKRDVLIVVGGFDEMLLRRCDDKYIAYTIKNSGYKIIYAPSVSLEHYIDENRLSNRLPEICKDTGHHEKIRLRNKPKFFNILKFCEYLFKYGASLILFIFFSLKGEVTRGKFIIEMRLWFLEGFLRKKPL